MAVILSKGARFDGFDGVAWRKWRGLAGQRSALRRSRITVGEWYLQDGCVRNVMHSFCGVFRSRLVYQLKQLCDLIWLVTAAQFNRWADSGIREPESSLADLRRRGRQQRLANSRGSAGNDTGTPTVVHQQLAVRKPTC